MEPPVGPVPGLIRSPASLGTGLYAEAGDRKCLKSFLWDTWMGWGRCLCQEPQSMLENFLGARKGEMQSKLKIQVRLWTCTLDP